MSKSLNTFHYESPDGHKYHFWNMLQSHSGIGMEPLKFIEDFGPNQNGSTVRDWRINPRTITLEFFKEGVRCCESRGELLAKLSNSVRPNRGRTTNDPGWLRFVNDSQIMMEIPAIYLKGVEGDYKYSGDVGKRSVQDNVQFYCADPIWREIKKESLSVGIDVEGFCLGESCLASRITHIYSDGETPCLSATSFFIHSLGVFYNGTWDGDQIDIRILGPMTNPTITNLTLGTTIELEYIIPDGNFVDIIIRPEYVTVFDNNGNNLIGSITSISDLVDFVIKSPGSITPSGYNNIVISGVASSEQSKTNMEYWLRHISAYGNPGCTDDIQEVVDNIEDENAVFLSESETSLAGSIVLIPDAPNFTEVWTISEMNGRKYSYSTPSFDHTIHSIIGGEQLTITLNKLVKPYVLSMNLENNFLVRNVDLVGFSRCTDIRLGNNRIEYIYNADRLRNLTSFRADNNELTRLEVTNFNIGLTTLDLSSNRLSYIGDVATLVNLEYLYLDNNKLTSIGSTPITNLQNLIYCYLHKNYNLGATIDLSLFGLDLLSLSLEDTQCNLSAPNIHISYANVLELTLSNISETVTIIDDILAMIWENRADFTGNDPILVLDGTNPSPSGVYQTALLPSTGKEYAYDLINDDNHEGFEKWQVLFNP